MSMSPHISALAHRRAPVLCLLTMVLTVFSAVPLSAPAQEAPATDFLQDGRLVPKRYVGLWHEVARTPNFFEDNTLRVGGERFGPCFNATATYTAESPFLIGVFNLCTRESLDTPGQIIEDGVEGDALITLRSKARKLKLAFGPPLVQLITRLFTNGGADYWVYGLGPVNSDGVYSWALVSGPERDYIFVLSRTRDPDSATVTEILDLAAAEGLPVDDLIFTQR